MKKNKKKFNFQLSRDSFSKSDIAAGVNVLLSKKITMGPITRKFEKQFQKILKQEL